MTNLSVFVNSQPVHVQLCHSIEAVERVLPDELYLGMYRAAINIGTYPPTLPRQEYIRTGVFGNSIYVGRPDMNSKTATMTLAAVQKGNHYSSYVAGDKNGLGQAAIHVGRWTVARIAVDEEVYVKVPQAVDRRLQAEFDKDNS